MTSDGPAPPGVSRALTRPCGNRDTSRTRVQSSRASQRRKNWKSMKRERIVLCVLLQGKPSFDGKHGRPCTLVAGRRLGSQLNAVGFS